MFVHACRTERDRDQSQLSSRRFGKDCPDKYVDRKNRSEAHVCQKRSMYVIWMDLLIMFADYVGVP